MTLKSDRPTCSTNTPSSDSHSDETPEFSQDEIFHILQTNRRRAVIRYLLDKEDSVKMRDLAELIAAKEHETTVTALTSTQRQRVYIPLYQEHLPKLDKKEIIEYEQSRGIVRPTDKLEAFRPYLEVPNERDDGDQSGTTSRHSSMTETASDYYVIALCASSGLLAASVIGLLPISGQTLATLTLLLFTVVTFVTSFSVPHSSSAADESSSTILTYQE